MGQVGPLAGIKSSYWCSGWLLLRGWATAVQGASVTVETKISAVSRPSLGSFYVRATSSCSVSLFYGQFIRH